MVELDVDDVDLDGIMGVETEVLIVFLDNLRAFKTCDGGQSAFNEIISCCNCEGRLLKEDFLSYKLSSNIFSTLLLVVFKYPKRNELDINY